MKRHVIANIERIERPAMQACVFKMLYVRGCVSIRIQGRSPRQDHERGEPTPNYRPWHLRRDTGGSSLGYRLLLQELAFDALGVGFVVGNLCVDLLLVCEIVGKGGVHSGRGEMLVFTHDVFRAMTQIVQ